jgi:hypothetical protein
MMTVRTHNGGDSKLLLLGVLEETKDIVADNDAGLAVKLLKDTHDEVCTKMKKVISGEEERGEMVSTSSQAVFTERRKRADFK